MAPGENYVALCAHAVEHGSLGAEPVRDAVLSVLDGSQQRADATYPVALASDDEVSREAASWYSLRVTRCDGPEPLRAVVTHEDITAERGARVRERELLEARAARAAAEAASRAKSEFLTTLSHELRTPLNAIAGYAQLLEMGVRGPVTLQQAEDLRRILRSERHLLGLINELLDFSRLKRGDVSLQLAVVELGRTVRDVLELVEPQAAAQELTLTAECVDTAIEALADPEKVRQILVNLLSTRSSTRGRVVRFASSAPATTPLRMSACTTLVLASLRR